MENQSGLVFSYILHEGSGTSATWDDVKAWTPKQGILWIHLDYQEEPAKHWLLHDSGLDPVTVDALLDEETRPRIASTTNTLLLILRGINYNIGADPEDMVSIRIWIDEYRIITMRHRRVLAIDDIRERIEKGTAPSTTCEFMVYIVDKMVDRMGSIISEIDDQADELEDLVLTQDSTELRPMVAQLRRKIISLRRYLAPQRDVLVRLHHEKIPWIDDQHRAQLREVAERTARYVDDLDAARDRAVITQEELNSRHSDQSNKTMYILSIVTAIFLPLGLLTGLLGINVGGMPGTDNKYAFSVVSAILLIFAFVQYLIFRRKKII